MHHHSHGTTSPLHQTILAFNIFGSLCCYVLVQGGAGLLASAQHPAAAPAGNTDSDGPWIKATYAMLAIFSFSAHSGVVGAFGSPTSLGSQMAPEIHFFLQWDFVIFVFSTSVSATKIAEAMYCDRKDG